MRPGKTVREMIKNVMQGKDEGADDYDPDEGSPSGRNFSGGIGGKVCMLCYILWFILVLR